MTQILEHITLAQTARPLLDFYNRAGEPAPELIAIDGEEIPEPYQELLVHDDDMTPTLEKFHSERIHLRLIGKEQSKNSYVREVVLEAGSVNKPVEFGAIAIHLEHFPEHSQQLILGESVPLGTILGSHNIKHQSHPQAYFKVQSDPLITKAFGLPKPTGLYGRCNVHKDLEGNHLAEIVEILPPA